MNTEVFISDYHYALPDERIARYPVEPRDTSRLLVYEAGKVAHQRFYDLPQILPKDSFLIFNDTKVIPARVHFQKATGAVIEVFLLHPELPSRIINDTMTLTDSCTWSCIVGNKKRWKSNESLRSSFTINGIACEITATWYDVAQNWITFHWEAAERFTFAEVIKALGEIPLPPYLGREADERDTQTYQTVYSKADGAVAAPTAGLHFTDEVFAGLAQKGIHHDFVTLHVGAGTFQPVKVANAVEHKMHAEQVVFKRSLIENILAHLGQLVVVGTTSMRSLESLYWWGVNLIHGPTDAQNSLFFVEKLAPYQSYPREISPEESLMAILHYMNQHQLDELTGETEIMIFPSYAFQLCRGLITNFHQPGSTLMLLVAAFVGDDWRSIYAEALAHDYRFLSYGDSSLLMPNSA
ncbi:MAG: S-adenosylmethionine:tRNA ribosyltransferase-isomerase [Spirosomaceae bacterium]|jgi:S-adenosylmethionine:tRNA ribosyltransferase-isomerase|nr:S-adenosylmethionine:tRNA ribosyltransferase-isomerase [Spirosomataceae bacterium]